MLRIGSLLRNKQLIKKTVLRAGMPGWDRPDPPSTKKSPRTRRVKLLLFS